MDFDDAKKLEEDKKWIKAAEKYKNFALNNPENPNASEAFFRAARIYAEKYNLCQKSKPLLERLLRNYPDFKQRKEAERMIFFCPDYFPISIKRKWVYGDSQTLGKNMKQIVKVKACTPGKAIVEVKFYAGRKFIQKNEKKYIWDISYIKEKSTGTDFIVLKYPIRKKDRWKGRQNKNTVYFEVVKTGLSVKVAAGVFEGCVKIKQKIPGMTSWLYVYYAPWVGKILTATAGMKFENRVEELLSYAR